MYLISAEGYKNADVHFLKVRKTGEIWPSMKNSGSGMSVKNISDLVLKKNIWQIPKCAEFEVKSKIGKLFINEKIIE